MVCYEQRSTHSLTHFWYMTGSSSGQSAMQPARSPPGQAELVVVAGSVGFVGALVVSGASVGGSVGLAVKTQI